MKKIGIITPPFIGHINPTLSFGKILIEKGYHVCWLSMSGHIAEIIPAGGEFIKIDAYQSQAAMDDLALGLESLEGLYEEMFLPMNIHMYNALKPYIKDGNFDMLITDHQAFAGGALAHECNIPFVTSVTAPAAVVPSPNFPGVIDFERSQIVKFQKSVGIDVPEPLVCSSPLTLVYSTSEFLEFTDFPETFRFVGPSTKDRFEYGFYFDWIDTMPKENPKVLITMGSILKVETDLLDKIVDAFTDQKVQIILNCDPALRKDWPWNFLVYPYIPQLQMLERVDAVICHAGYNTVSEALSYGLPIITLPMVNDQSYVATKVKNSGAGIRLKYRRVTSEQIRESLFELLSNPSYRTCAQHVKESFTEAGGSLRAAHLIEEFIHQHTSIKEYNG